MNIFDNIFDENLITVYWKRWKDPTEQVVWDGMELGEFHAAESLRCH
jgi:hypothetical protein